MNTAELDIAFRAFTKVRQEWISTLHQFAIYPLEGDEEVARPVAVIGGDEFKPVLARLEHLVVEWQRFYDLAEKYRKEKISPIPYSLYAPVPFIVPKCDFITLSIEPGSNTSKCYTWKVISMIETQLKKLKKPSRKKISDEQREADEDRRMLLQSDLARFQEYPEDTVFVRRQDGYSNVVLFLKDEATIDEVTTPATIFDGFTHRETARVGQYGCVIQKDALRYEVAIRDKRKTEPGVLSVYARIDPVQCSALTGNVSLYLLEEIEQARKDISAEAAIRKREMGKFYLQRSRRETLLKKGRATNVVVPENKRKQRRLSLSELAVPLDPEKK